MNKSRFLFVFLSSMAILAVGTPEAFAFGTYSTGVSESGNCADCHGKFKGDPYVSHAEGITWAKNLHDTHLDNTDVESNPNGSCDNCHGGSGTSGREVNLVSSGNAKDGVNAIGCMGCHGRIEDTLDDIGAGLRAHHMNSDGYVNWPGGLPGVGLSCAQCHSGDPATPASEDVAPPWYSSVINTSIMKVMDTCSRDGEEDFSSNGTGLDNDGDGLYDVLDPDCEIPIPEDISGFADVSGDGLADLATFVGDTGGQPKVQLYSGANGDNFGALNFLNPNWEGVAIDTVDDSNGDGVADDPGVAMLLIETATGRMLVQTRETASGASVSKINFLNPNWTPIDVVVLNDTNGDGNPNDASIGVMAREKTTGKTLVQVRNLSNGTKIATRSFLNSDYAGIAATSASRAGQTPLLGVLGVEKATGKTLVQTRQLSDGALVDNAKYLNTDWEATDIAAVKDNNSDGTADDPGWLVLANHTVTNVTLVQARYAATGAKIANITYLTTDHVGTRLATSPDISGNSREEASVYGKRLSDEQPIIQIRDFENAARTGNIFP